MITLPLEQQLLFPAILFAVGLAGVIIRRNLLFVLVAVEIMLNACAAAFVLVGNHYRDPQGQGMFIMILAVAAVEAAVGLALTILVVRRTGTLDTRSLVGTAGNNSEAHGE